MGEEVVKRVGERAFPHSKDEYEGQSGNEVEKAGEAEYVAEGTGEMETTSVLSGRRG